MGWFWTINESIPGIRYKLKCAYSEYSNQSAHPHSLIRVLVFRLKNIRPIENSDQTGRVQSGQSLRSVHMPICTFGCVPAQTYVKERKFSNERIFSNYGLLECLFLLYMYVSEFYILYLHSMLKPLSSLC